MATLKPLDYAATRLGISYEHATELARTRILPAVKIGRLWRIDPDKLDEWIEQGGQALPGGWRREPASTQITT